MFFSPTHVYVKIHEDSVEAKHLETQHSVRLISPEPFTTSRLLVGEFTIAEKLIKSAVQQCCSKKKLTVSPNILIHPLEKVEGGLSEVEKKTFLELAIFAGARDAIVWVGAELVDFQILEKFTDPDRCH
jgi:rod shape-determining protein MreB and related proteins